MQPIYEFLYRNDLLKHNKPNVDHIKKLTKSQIFTTIEEIINIGKNEEVSRERSIFAQSASHSLGGGTNECSGFSCRLRKIDELARYSLLYADKVYIDNFLIRYRHFRNYSLLETQKFFCDDLALLWYLEPFIERGVIKIFTPKSDVCPHCLCYLDENKYLNHEQIQQLSEIRNQILFRYLNESTASFVKGKSGLGLELHGPEELIAHGNIIFHINPSCYLGVNT